MDIHLFATRRNQVFVAITILLVGMLMVSTSAAAPPAQQATPTYKWTPTPLPTSTLRPTPTSAIAPTAAPPSKPEKEPVPQPTPMSVLLPETGDTSVWLALPSLLLIATGLVLWMKGVKRET